MTAAPAAVPAEALAGPDFFSLESVLAEYRTLRGQDDAPHETIELPAVLDFLGDVTGRSILDVGCGDAWIGRYVLERGATRYMGVDGSSRMVEAACRTLDGTSGRARLGDLERWCGTGELFDVALSRLTLHFVRDVARVLAVLRHELRPGGLLVISIEHPLLTSSLAAQPAAGIPETRVVGDYFREGPRTHEWLGAIVVKYHRTLATYAETLGQCGFRIDRLSEGLPRSERFVDPERFEQRLQVPTCVVFRCVRDD